MRNTKIALVGAPGHDGTIAARYFTPWTCHSAFAVAGLVRTARPLFIGTVHVPFTQAHIVA